MVLRLLFYNLSPFGFVSLSWVARFSGLFGLTEWLCPYPFLRDFPTNFLHIYRVGSDSSARYGQKCCLLKRTYL
jgi:hypothetical protein